MPLPDTPAQGTFEIVPMAAEKSIMVLEYVTNSSAVDCVAKEINTVRATQREICASANILQGKTWAMHANVDLDANESKPNVQLDQVRFTLTETTTNEVLENCSINVVAAPAA